MASQLENLEALLALLWESLGTAEADKRASLAREYRATLDKVESLRAVNKVGDPVDEVANRRAARRSSSTKSSARAK